MAVGSSPTTPIWTVLEKEVAVQKQNLVEVWPRGLRYWFAKSVRQDDAERNVVRFHEAYLIAPLYPDAPKEQSVGVKLREKRSRNRNFVT